MIKLIVIFGFGFLLMLSCQSTKTVISENKNFKTTQNDTIRIANDTLQYEVVIIDPGFNAWLTTNAKPRNFYGLTFLEIRNNLYINQWNNRVLDPYRYDPNLYEMRIDYDANTHYGYEVNYLIYNYFIYFQNQYKQKL